MIQTDQNKEPEEYTEHTITQNRRYKLAADITIQLERGKLYRRSKTEKRRKIRETDLEPMMLMISRTRRR